MEIASSSETFPVTRRRWWKNRSFLFISVGIHLLFGIGAAYLVVSKYSGTRKLTFAAGPKSPNPAERALQHRVQLQQKTQSITAPAAVPKRVLTTGAAKVAGPTGARRAAFRWQRPAAFHLVRRAEPRHQWAELALEHR